MMEALKLAAALLVVLLGGALLLLCATLLGVGWLLALMDKRSRDEMARRRASWPRKNGCPSDRSGEKMGGEAPGKIGGG